MTDEFNEILKLPKLLKLMQYRSPNGTAWDDELQAIFRILTSVCSIGELERAMLWWMVRIARWKLHRLIPLSLLPSVAPPFFSVEKSSIFRRRNTTPSSDCNLNVNSIIFYTNMTENCIGILLVFVCNCRKNRWNFQSWALNSYPLKILFAGENWRRGNVAIFFRLRNNNMDYILQLRTAISISSVKTLMCVW